MSTQDTQHEKPFILKEGTYKSRDVDRITEVEKIWAVRDIFDLQVAELFEVTHPEFRGKQEFGARQEKFVEEYKQEKGAAAGNWIYYPWSGILVHTVNEDEYYLLRTNRNRNLITQEEQEKVHNFPLGIAGLSVGSNVALAAAYMGMGKTMKLAEYDTIETTNLNRIRARIDEIGMSKMDSTCRRLYEVDPYIQPSLKALQC